MRSLREVSIDELIERIAASNDKLDEFVSVKSVENLDGEEVSCPIFYSREYILSKLRELKENGTPLEVSLVIFNAGLSYEVSRSGYILTD